MRATRPEGMAGGSKLARGGSKLKTEGLFGQSGRTA